MAAAMAMAGRRTDISGLPCGRDRDATQSVAGAAAAPGVLGIDLRYLRVDASARVAREPLPQHGAELHEVAAGERDDAAGAADDEAVAGVEPRRLERHAADLVDRLGVEAGESLRHPGGVAAAGGLGRIVGVDAVQRRGRLVVHA